MKFRFVPAVPALLSCGLFATGTCAIAQDATVYTWQFAYTKAEVTRYDVTLNVTGKQPGTNTDFTITTKSGEKRTVTAVGDAGQGTILVVLERNAIDVNGTGIPDDPGGRPVITRIMSKDGIMLKHDAANITDQSRSLLDVECLFFDTPAPSRAIKMGESWQSTPDNPFVPNTKLTIASTLVGKEKVGDHDTFKVKYNTKVPMAMGAADPATITETYYVDPSDMRVVRISATADNVSISTPSGAITVKLQMEMTLTGADTEKSVGKDAAK